MMASQTPPQIRGELRTARLVLSEPPPWHVFAEVGMRFVALSAITAVLLIFAFVAREAWPLLTSSEIHKEVTLRKMWTAPGMPQAARVSAFFYMGELIEYDRTNTIFTKPTKSKTEDYITGRFG